MTMVERFRFERLETTEARVPERLRQRAISSVGEFTWLGKAEFVALVTFPLGVVRGQHVHRRRTETLCLVSGLLEGVFRDQETGTRWTRTIEVGDLVVVGPRIEHAYRALRYSQAIETADRAWEPDDVEPVELL